MNVNDYNYYIWPEELAQEAYEWSYEPHGVYIPYRRCDCGGKGTGNHKDTCAYVKSYKANNGEYPSNVTILFSKKGSNSTKGNTMSTLKFSSINTGDRVQRRSVREVTKVSSAVRVVGMQYARSLPLVKRLEVGTSLQLQAEPSNPADPNAVRVYFGTTPIGYIERAEAKAVCDVLSSLGNGAVKAVVSRIDTRSDLYNMLWVVLEATFYVSA